MLEYETTQVALPERGLFKLNECFSYKKRFFSQYNILPKYTVKYIFLK